MAEVQKPGLDPIEGSAELHLDGLDEKFLQAMALREADDIDGAIEALDEIIRIEPRLAEPRLELANIYLQRNQLEEAEGQAREAVRILELGGQWNLDIAENVMQSLAWATVGEILRLRADTDDVVFGEPAVWRELTEASATAFGRAAALDPDNTHATLWASRFNLSKQKGSVLGR